MKTQGEGNNGTGEGGEEQQVYALPLLLLSLLAALPLLVLLPLLPLLLLLLQLLLYDTGAGVEVDAEDEDIENEDEKGADETEEEAEDDEAAAADDPVVNALRSNPLPVPNIMSPGAFPALVFALMVFEVSADDEEVLKAPRLGVLSEKLPIRPGIRPPKPNRPGCVSDSWN